VPPEREGPQSSSGGPLVELVEELVDAPIDLVADLAHPLERLILRVGRRQET
jgi:hypothetical protein